MKKFKIFFILIAIFLTGCNNSNETSNIEKNNISQITSTIEESLNLVDTNIEESSIIEESTIIESSSTIEEILPPEPIINKVELVAVGDNLIHSMVIKSGKQEDGTYDYNYMYENIKEHIEDADIKVINQETMLIKDPNKYSGYPTFGSPIEIGEAILNSGFNVITCATNHSFDKKEEGIMDTIEFFDNKENITLLGIHNNEEDSNEISIVEYNDISFAMLNYTYGLNGFQMPNGKEYLVDTFMNDNEKQIMLLQINKASTMADFTIVFMHWGIEYTIEETQNQRDLALEIANAGADIIIGTHPHVVEPLKEITTEDGRIVPVYYSLGNFVSNQDRLDTMIGGMAKVTFIKENDNCYIENTELIPLVTNIQNGQKFFNVYTLEEYNEELINTHKLKSKGLTLEYIKNRFNEILSLGKEESF